MAVDQTTVRRIAKLARIKLADDEVAAFEGELNAILHWIEQLDEVDVAGVAPMTSVVHMQMKTRDDEVTDGGSPADILANAPMTQGHYFMVPKVVESS